MDTDIFTGGSIREWVLIDAIDYFASLHCLTCLLAIGDSTACIEQLPDITICALICEPTQP